MTGKRGWYWPFLLGGLMAIVLGANLVLVYMATSDPSFAVEEDYYRKALEWDLKRAQDQTNAELGWQLDFELAPNRSPDGSLIVLTELRDRSGVEIVDASIRLSAFHNARAAQILRADLRRGTDGAYAAALPLRRPGLWEFRFEVRRGTDRFTLTAMRELAAR